MLMPLPDVAPVPVFGGAMPEPAAPPPGRVAVATAGGCVETGTGVRGAAVVEACAVTLLVVVAVFVFAFVVAVPVAVHCATCSADMLPAGPTGVPGVFVAVGSATAVLVAVDVETAVPGVAHTAPPADAVAPECAPIATAKPTTSIPTANDMDPAKVNLLGNTASPSVALTDDPFTSDSLAVRMIGVNR